MTAPPLQGKGSYKKITEAWVSIKKTTISIIKPTGKMVGNLATEDKEMGKPFFLCFCLGFSLEEQEKKGPPEKTQNCFNGGKDTD